MPYQPDTLAIHAGQVPDPATNARAVPIYATTSYVFNDTQHAADLFGLRVFGNIYTRIMNPTSDVFEKRMAELEGGIAALAVASGQAATTLTVLNLARGGRQPGLVADAVRRHLQPVRALAPQVGHHDPIRGHPQPRPGPRRHRRRHPAASSSRPSATRGSTSPTSRRWRRSPTRPAIPLVVDNTFGAATLSRPIEYGADIVVHSATKWIGGHGTAIGGVVVDAGKFDWTSDSARARFPSSPQPDPSYHGLVYTEAFGPARVHHQAAGAAAARPRPRAVALQLLPVPAGARDAAAPHPAALARARSRWRGGWPRTRGSNGCRIRDWRRIPSTRTPPSTSRGGFGGVLTFGVKGGHAAAKALIDRVKLFSLLANVGDAKSLIIHPASTTHEQLTPEQQLATGTTPELVRLSVGLEDLRDLIADLDQALGELGDTARSRETAASGAAR